MIPPFLEGLTNKMASVTQYKPYVHLYIAKADLDNGSFEEDSGEERCGSSYRGAGFQHLVS